MPAELTARFGGITLHGTSVAARATAFAVPELGVTLDLGRLSPMLAAQPVVLLSHGHLDHLAAVLAYLNLRARFHAAVPPRVVVPSEIAADLRRALEAMPGMESVRKRFSLEEVVREASAGDVVELPGGIARAFACDHSVPTLGWRLFRAGGERAVVSYAADGSTGPFVSAPELLDAEVAVVECSFAGRNRRIAARLAKHAHLLDWVVLAPRLTCDVLVLAHLPELPREEFARLLEPLAAALPPGTRAVAWTR